MGTTPTLDALFLAISLLMQLMHCSRAGSLQIETAHLFSVPISVSYAVTGDDFHTASMGASGKGVAATHGRTVVDTRVVPEGNTVDADSLTWVTMGDGITESRAFSVGSNHPHRLRLRERTSSPHAAPMPARGRCPPPYPSPSRHRRREPGTGRRTRVFFFSFAAIQKHSGARFEVPTLPVVPNRLS